VEQEISGEMLHIRANQPPLRVSNLPRCEGPEYAMNRSLTTNGIRMPLVGNTLLAAIGAKNLGRVFRDGLGVQRHIEKAKAEFRRALQWEDLEARDQIKALEEPSQSRASHGRFRQRP
jgi:hypothetical protein